MSKLSNAIDKTQKHMVTIRGRHGKVWLELSLFWALLIAVAAPQALLLVVLLYLVDVIEVELDGEPMTFASELFEKEPPESADTA